MTLDEVELSREVTVTHVGGDRSFRRRLMELGLLPGTQVAMVRVAPLGDPVELSVRGCRLSIRRAEASSVRVAQATRASEALESAKGELAFAESPIR